MWINELELELEKLLSLCPLQYHGKSIEVERIFFEDFYEQKFQETEKERKMSVWRMETSDDRENVAACAATVSRFLVAEVTQVVLRDFGSSGREAMSRLPASTFSIWGYREQQNNVKSLKLTRGHGNESLLVYGLQMVYTKLRVHSTVERARVGGRWPGTYWAVLHQVLPRAYVTLNVTRYKEPVPVSFSDFVC